MARSAEDMRLTGIDMHQGAPAPEPPRVPRISLTFSGLPPADGQTIVTRERGVARQTLGREARIEDSSLLTDGGPDDRDQHNRDSWHEDVQHTKKKMQLMHGTATRGSDETTAGSTNCKTKMTRLTAHGAV